MRPARLLALIAVCVAVAIAAAPASAARVVNGAVGPGGLTGKPTALMFFHPF